MTQSERVIAVARRELGNSESPAGSNRTKYGVAYGMDGQPWCVMFLWWVFQMAGLGRLFCGGGKTASCGELLRWAKTEGLTVPANEVQPGDIVILGFPGKENTWHCGLVADTEVFTGLWFRAIEGNAAPGWEESRAGGGCVALKVRFPRQIVGVIRPGYKEGGICRPDQTVTQDESMTMSKRYDEWTGGGER